MISAWDIYWVMQLDSIGCAFLIASLVATGVGVVALVCNLVNRDMQSIYSENDGSRGFKEYGAKAASWASVAKKTLPVGLLLIAANAFIPSTKTAAMMVVVPRIANSETIQREAGDLYGIAKQALRELAKPDKEAAK